MHELAITSSGTQTSATAVAGEILPLQEPSVQLTYTKFQQRPDIQPKLTVGAPDGLYEKEADAVADKVMRMPEPAFIANKIAGSGPQQLQSKTEEEGLIYRKREDSGSFIQIKCAEYDKEEGIQRKPLAGSITPFLQTKSEGESTVSHDLSHSIQSSRGSGAPLDPTTHSFMSSRFGNDFSEVKIHTDSQSVGLNRKLNARAFTVGKDVYFNQGQYQPQSSEGKQLLAHELTHVVQQAKKLPDLRLIQRTCDLDFTGYSGPDCEGTIYVGATTISNPLAGYYHLFVLYTDNTGSQYYLRGGPGESETGYGSIITGCAPYTEEEIEYDSRNVLEEVYQGSDACGKLNLMQDKLNEIEGWNVPYGPAGPNSNSVIATLLEASGLPKRKPAVPTPGFEMEVTSSGGQETGQERPTIFLLSFGGGNGFLLNAEVQKRLHTFSPMVGNGLPIPIPLQLDAGFYSLPVQGRFGGSVGLSTDISIFNLPLWAFSPLGITLGGGITAGGIRTEQETGASRVESEFGGYARAGIYTDIDRWRISPQYQFNVFHNSGIDSTTTLHSLIIQLGYTF